MAVVANLGNKLLAEDGPLPSLSSVGLAGASAGSAATQRLAAPRAEVRLAGQSKIRIVSSPSRVVIQKAPLLRGRTLLVNLKNEKSDLSLSANTCVRQS